MILRGSDRYSLLEVGADMHWILASLPFPLKHCTEIVAMNPSRVGACAFKSINLNRTIIHQAVSATIAHVGVGLRTVSMIVHSDD